MCFRYTAYKRDQISIENTFQLTDLCNVLTIVFGNKKMDRDIQISTGRLRLLDVAKMCSDDSKMGS